MCYTRTKSHVYHQPAGESQRLTCEPLQARDLKKRSLVFCITILGQNHVKPDSGISDGCQPMPLSWVFKDPTHGRLESGMLQLPPYTGRTRCLNCAALSFHIPHNVLGLLKLKQKRPRWLSVSCLVWLVVLN